MPIKPPAARLRPSVAEFSDFLKMRGPRCESLPVDADRDQQKG
jgi:hypothetical protein